MPRGAACTEGREPGSGTSVQFFQRAVRSGQGLSDCLLLVSSLLSSSQQTRSPQPELTTSYFQLRDPNGQVTTADRVTAARQASQPPCGGV